MTRDTRLVVSTSLCITVSFVLKLMIYQYQVDCLPEFESDVRIPIPLISLAVHGLMDHAIGRASGDQGLRNLLARPT